MPKPAADNRRQSLLPEARADDPQRAVVNGLLTYDEFVERRQRLSSECQLLDVVRGQLAPVDTAQLIQELRTKDSRIQFFQHQADAADERAPKIEVRDAVVLENFRVAAQPAKLERGAMPKVITAPRAGSFAAAEFAGARIGRH